VLARVAPLCELSHRRFFFVHSGVRGQRDKRAWDFPVEVRCIRFLDNGNREA